MTDMTQYINPASIESLPKQAFDACAECAESLYREHVRLPEAEYFLDVLNAHFDPAPKERPGIIVFGTNFPMELVHALTGKPPYWVVGGSRVLQDASNESVPRDTDPVTRAALGELFAHEEWRETALVVVPCSSDARRKAAYLLQSRGWKVVTIWIPAVKDSLSHKSFLSELSHAVDAICRHAGKRYSVFALDKSAKYFNDIRADLQAFRDAARENEYAMPGPMWMAVLDSFFLCRDLDEWHDRLKQLTRAIQAAPPQRDDHPRVLLIGSPIFFPNYKIPELLSTTGVTICETVDCRTGIFGGNFGSEEKGLAALAHDYFEHDSSSAFVRNDQLAEAIRAAVERSRPDGVIWHVLKGQIEYDFELQRCEGYFEENDLPVIRLETDYQYQDVEQLRIRIEAFAELLTQKRTEKGAAEP